MRGYTPIQMLVGLIVIVVLAIVLIKLLSYL